jgi:hypothetical protein
MHRSNKGDYGLSFETAQGVFRTMIMASPGSATLMLTHRLPTTFPSPGIFGHYYWLLFLYDAVVFSGALEDIVLS